MDNRGKIIVMQITNSFSLAGAEKVAIDLAIGIDKERFEVFVCSIGSRKDEIEVQIRKNLESKGIKTLSLEKPKQKERIRAIWKLGQHLRHHDINILHTHCPLPDFYGKFAALSGRTAKDARQKHTATIYRKQQGERGHVLMSGKSKIAVMHVINAYALGGAEKLVFDIASRMDKTKFDVFVCSIGTRGDDIEQAMRHDLQNQGIQTLSLDKVPRRQRLRTVLKLAKILSKNKIDIIHTHCPSPDFYGRLAACLSRVPLAFSTIHNTEGYLRRNEKILNYLTTRYIAISEQVKKYAVGDLQIPAGKIVLIYNGIDMEKYQKPAVLKQHKLTELRIPSDKKIITNIARIAEQKGQLYLIQAAKIILKEFPQTHFLILGDDQTDKKLAQELKRLVKAENLGDHITFAGVRQDVPEILAITDVFAFPSLWEGFSLVTLEVMAAGVPMVATDVGSIREVLVNRENGLIIPPKDAKALAEGIKFMLSDPERAKAMGLKGKKAVEEKFTIEDTVRGYEELYLSGF